MLTVVVLAIALASLSRANFRGRRARQVQEEFLLWVVATLTEAPFPLSEYVLKLMSGLSVVVFVLLSRETWSASGHHIGTKPRRLGAGAGDSQRTVVQRSLRACRTTSVAGRVYLSQRVPVLVRQPVSRAGSLALFVSRGSLVGPRCGTSVDLVLMAGAVAGHCGRRGWPRSGTPFRPSIRHLGERAAAIARGDFQPVAVARHNDEIRDLAVSINQMARQLGQYEVQVRTNRFDARPLGGGHGPSTATTRPPAVGWRSSFTGGNAPRERFANRSTWPCDSCD